jgi:cell shape-determining protein MreC
MCCKGFLKRILPFFLTFAFGLLIASFFVSITPNFKFQKRGWSRHQQYHQRLESENQRLREENNLLKRQLSEADSMMPTKLEVRRLDTITEVPLPPPPPKVKIVRGR